jgi:hypothetical protein
LSRSNNYTGYHNNEAFETFNIQILNREGVFMMRSQREWNCGLKVACCGMLVALASKAGATDTPAALTVAMAPQQVQQAIVKAVQNTGSQREEHRRYRMALPFAAQLFPPDAYFAAQSAGTSATASPITSGSRTVAAWLSLPAAQRQYDVLITPDVDYYWDAEGRKYNCQFLIHVDAQNDTGSRLELLQVRPTVYAGKRFDLLGRTGPGRYLDLQPAMPSMQTEAELRAFLAAALTPKQ